MTANQTFQLEETRGWRMGLKNLMRKESVEWWKTRRWWIQLLLWSIVINSLILLVIYAFPHAANLAGQEIPDSEIFLMAIQVLFFVASLGFGLGVVIISQDEIISEKTNGTAAWVLSKPATRVAFYLSKLFVNGFSVLILMITIPMAIAFIVLSLSYPELNVMAFLVAVGILVIHTFFYLCLSLMVGVFSEKRSLVLSLTLGALLGGQVLMNFVKEIVVFTPFGLSQIMIGIIVEGLNTIPVILWIPVGATFLFSVIFIFLSVWKIQKLEF
ncbi:MAG TPA: ABC transporter permease subunit [Anaerolineaceae bacterium]|nr:ABC transporter permease subunit [Anaerolineaceae bacterium]